MRYLLLALLLVLAVVGAALFDHQTDANEYLNRGIAWEEKREYDKAIAEYTEAIRLNPQLALAFFNRGILWKEKGEYDKAIADFTEAIHLNPQNADAFFTRGCVWYEKGEHDKAIDDFSNGIGLNAQDAGAFTNRGALWRLKGEHDKAIADYSEAIRLNPQRPYAFFNRAGVWYEKGKYERSIADYAEAIRLDPQNAVAFSYRASILATCPDARFRSGSEALHDATRACELTEWKESMPICTLSAAYAEAGNFPLATKWIKKALSMDDADNVTRRQMLKLFEDGKPYRDEPRK